MTTHPPSPTDARSTTLASARTAHPRRRFSVNALLDQAFFVLGGVAAAWLAWVLFDDGLRSGWAQVWFYLVVWLLVAYLVLPRLHRILTQLYVPNYFIGRARTSDGLLGDPVNLGVRGTEAQLRATMAKARWTLADPVTLRSSWRIVMSTLTRRSYHEAPVSPLFVFGTQQDLAYQQEVAGNPAKRHHVRFWRCPEGWLLPGGYAVDWVAAGTFDRAVGLSLFTLQVTHKIDPDTDVERDHIVSTVREADAAVTVSVIDDFSTGYHSRNGGGDTIVTDGDLPIIDLRAVEIPEAATTAGDPSTSMSETTDARAAVDGAHAAPPRIRRPLSTVVGALMIVGNAIVGFVSIALVVVGDVTLADLTAIDSSSTEADLGIVHAVILGFIGGLALLEVLLAIAVFAGSNVARITALTLGVFTALSAFIAVAQGGAAISFQTNLAAVSFDVLVLLALSSRASRVYARRPRPSRRERRERRRDDRAARTIRGA